VFEDPKEKIWHEVRYTANGEAFIYEMRRLKGKFFETMELDNFPFDIQVSMFRLLHQSSVDKIFV